MEHAPCTLGGVKSDRAHFVGGGRHNLLLRALRLIILKKIPISIPSFRFCISLLLCVSAFESLPSKFQTLRVIYSPVILFVPCTGGYSVRLPSAKRELF